jgi:hypothetical protein
MFWLLILAITMGMFVYAFKYLNKELEGSDNGAAIFIYLLVLCTYPISVPIICWVAFRERKTEQMITPVVQETTSNSVILPDNVVSLDNYRHSSSL